MKETNDSDAQLHGSWRVVRWLPSSMLVLSAVLVIGSLWLLLLKRGTTIGQSYGPRGFQALFSLVFALVGALIATGRPRNLIGWLFCWVGLLAALQGFTVEYAIYTLLTHPGTLPYGLLAAWLQYWVWIIFAFPVIVFVPLLFPEGRLLSPRWSPVAWLASASIVVGTVSFAFMPGIIGEEFETLQNPYALQGYGDWMAIGTG